MKNNKTIALIACAVAALGSFMPWVTAQTIFGSIDIAGTDGDGVITLILACVTAFLIYKGSKKMFVGALVTSGLGTLVSVYNVVNVNNKINQNDDMNASIGYGLYLCVIGFLVVIAMLISLRKSHVLQVDEQHEYMNI